LASQPRELLAPSPIRSTHAARRCTPSPSPHAGLHGCILGGLDVGVGAGVHEDDDGLEQEMELAPDSITLESLEAEKVVSPASLELAPDSMEMMTEDGVENEKKNRQTYLLE